MEFNILRTLRAEQITNPVNSFGDGIIKIVDDRNPKAFIEKLNHSVRANETGSFDNQNRLIIHDLFLCLQQWTSYNIAQ